MFVEGSKQSLSAESVEHLRQILTSQCKKEITGSEALVHGESLLQLFEIFTNCPEVDDGSK